MNFFTYEIIPGVVLGEGISTTYASCDSYSRI
jgi:hypothetical protein